MSDYRDVNFQGLARAGNPTKPSSAFKQVGTDDGVAQFYGNQYAQVGDLVDMWADLLEGHGERATDFWAAFLAHFRDRDIMGVGPYSRPLTATGLFAPYRQMEFVKRGVVNIPIYVATQGKDLYISWRAFVQGQISLVKLVVWLLVCLVIALPFSLQEKYVNFGETSTSINSGRWFILAIITIVATGVWAVAYGLFYRQGDWQALWREPVNELQFDDVASLTDAVHNSLIAAADKVGIDTTKLQEREPFYTPRGRKRRI